MNDKAIFEVFDHIKKAQQAAASEAAGHIMLHGIVFKTGRTSDGLRLDYIEASTQLFRDEIMAVSFCALSSLLLETGMSKETKALIVAVVAEARDQIEKSHAKFITLHNHLRETHIEEINNELERTLKCQKP